MAGLVGYASSSDDDEDVLLPEHQDAGKQADGQTSGAGHAAEGPEPLPAGEKEASSSKLDAPELRDSLEHRPPQSSGLSPETTVDAPILGPSLPTEADGYQVMDDGAPSNPSLASRPSSPYTANRELLRNLTLPPVPNVDVPPSPPGTPPPNHAALTAKFENFLELKRSRGTHFNARLAQSAAMRNPALMDKLLGFVGLDDPVAVAEEDGGRGGGVKAKDGPAPRRSMADQYATVLPPDVWDPTAFPEWAFRGPLRRTQEQMQKEREAERTSGRRDVVEFVPASSAGRLPTTAVTASSRKTRFDYDGQH